MAGHFNARDNPNGSILCRHRSRSTHDSNLIAFAGLLNNSVEPCQDALVEPRGRSAISSSTEQPLTLNQAQSALHQITLTGTVTLHHLIYACVARYGRSLSQALLFLENHENTTDISVTSVTRAIAPLGIPRLEKRFWFQKDRACDPDIITTQVRPGFSSPTYVVADI